MLEFLFAKDNVAFVLPGGFEIYKYALMITFGILASFALYLLLAKKRGIDLDFSLELFIWVIPLAVIFCRVFYVVPRLGKDYSLSTWSGFLDAIDIRGGGLTIIGGIFGGALGIFFCCLRNKKYSMMRVADCVVIALLVGQIIGRWGNYFNEELYGIEVTNEALQHFPFAVYIDALHSWHYASFFYEGVLNGIGLVIALLLFYLPKKPLKTGTFAIFYLAWYGLVRGSLEFIKGSDPATIGNTNIKMVQLICYVMCIVAIVLQVLLQCGKIRLETKWFQRLCEKKRIQLEEKAAAKASAGNADAQTNVEIGNASNGQSDVISSSSATEEKANETASGEKEVPSMADEKQSDAPSGNDEKEVLSAVDDIEIKTTADNGSVELKSETVEETPSSKAVEENKTSLKKPTTAKKAAPSVAASKAKPALTAVNKTKTTAATPNKKNTSTATTSAKKSAATAASKTKTTAATSNKKSTSAATTSAKKSAATAASKAKTTAATSNKKSTSTAMTGVKKSAATAANKKSSTTAKSAKK